MRPADWVRLEELFQTAVSLSPAEREAFLQRRCGDASLRSQVEALLQAHDEADGFLERPAVAEATRRWRIGPYEILKELGHGGMGTVYLARRAEAPKSPRLAIKIIVTDLDSKVARERFSQEKRTLATLHHRHIASFLDGGTTDSGQPYLVMEYVDGEPIDQFCDRLKLGVTERIQLFLSVCSAIRHAHQKLVIHRDLKPSNVLVTEEGIVKVVDFGTAKLLDPSLRLPGLASTVTGYLPMTPRYASPEQFRGESITTMTDVYGLGTLLYELLTGCSVHRFAGANPAEVVRVVCEEPPEKPSSLLKALPSRAPSGDVDPPEPSLATVAELRSTQPARLQRSLAGDLDKILMKSLRKEPGERYGSVESLAEDLKRYLDGLPVYARAGSWVYRSRKFLHRNRAAVVAATLALTSLLLFTLSSIRQERITDLQRQEAESEREKAETVADFLADLFEGAGAGGPGDRQPVLAILDRGTRRMKRVPNPHPTVQASLLEASGKAYRRMGFYDRAEPLLVESLTIRRAELGDHHLDTASSLHELGFLRFFQGKLEEGETLMLEALQLRESLAGTDALGVAESLDGLTELDLTAGINNAEDYSRRALAVRSRNLDQDHPAVGHSRARLGGVLVRHGKNVEGLVLLEEGFAAVEKAFGSQDPLTAHIAFDYGFALREVGSYDRAEKLIRLALRGYETSVGPDHPFSAACHGELGNIFLARHDPDSAEAEFRRARQLLTQRVGSDHPWLGALANHLGRACLARGDLECAAVQFRKSRDMVERMMGPESLDASFPMQYQGRIARLKGDLDEAEALLQKARTIRRKYLSESHLNFAHILHDLGRLYLDRGDVDQAEPLLRRALEIRGAGGVRGTLKLASNHLDLAEIEMLRGRHEDAVPLLEQALQGRHRVLGTEHELSLAAAEELEKARALASTPSR